MDKKNLTIKETFALAVQNHQKNNLQIAENFYKKILKKNPNHFQSNFQEKLDYFRHSRRATLF